MNQLIEFLFRLHDINLKTKEIETQEQAARQAQGVNQMLLESMASNSKQSLEVIKLTRVLTWLTIILVIIGVIQLYIMLTKP